MSDWNCYPRPVVDPLPRTIEPLIESTMGASPVVVLEGGRAVGKSTVCDVLVGRHGWPAIS